MNSTEFQSTALDSFTSYIGFSGCVGSGVQVAPYSLSPLPVLTVIATPTASNRSSLTPVTPGPNQTSTQSVSTHSSGFDDKKIKVANGVAIPLAFLGLVLLGFLLYRRRKIQKTRKEDNATPSKQESSHEDTQPYLQQKAELEAEEKRKYELEARERRYEIGNAVERYELPVEKEDLMIRTKQELRGEEHSTELEVPR